MCSSSIAMRPIYGDTGRPVLAPPAVPADDRTVSEGAVLREFELGEGVLPACEHGHAAAEDHRVRLDHELVDLVREQPGQLRTTAQPDPQTAVLRLELAHRTDDVVVDQLHVR